jgi:D-beta-D-heptose 7-phosphate kinase/D-beta-D-heptose 1-phosphate adenosyltransferase
VSNIAALGGRAAVCGHRRTRRGGKAADGRARRGSARRRTASSAAAGETTQKTRIIAHQQQVVRLDHEAGSGPDGASARRVRDFVLRARRRCDVLVVSDYAKGAVGPDLLDALATAARARRLHVGASIRSARTSRTTAARRS